MIITKTNVLLGVIPTITDPGVNQTPANITDPDHSTTYTSGILLGTDFRINFGAVDDVSYVAISGHNATSTGSGASIEVRDGATVIEAEVIQTNNNLIITFTKRDFTDLRVNFSVSPTSHPVTVTYIAAGEYLTVPNNGEQAGYTRAWMARQLTQRVSTNINSAPLALTKRRKPIKMSLSIPDATTTFSRGEWQTFLDFAASQPFFIRENDAIAYSTYICFDPDLNTVDAHASTRALDSIKLNFMAYNGL